MVNQSENDSQGILTTFLLLYVHEKYSCTIAKCQNTSTQCNSTTLSIIPSLHYVKKLKKTHIFTWSISPTHSPKPYHQKVYKIYAKAKSYGFWNFSIVYFLEFSVYSKIEGKVQRLLVYLLCPHMYSLSHYQHPLPEWYICYNSWTYIFTS